MILSELDDTPYIQVYDRTKLGSKSKIPVPKANIDYVKNHNDVDEGKLLIVTNGLSKDVLPQNEKIDLHDKLGINKESLLKEEPAFFALKRNNSSKENCNLYMYLRTA